MDLKNSDFWSQMLHHSYKYSRPRAWPDVAWASQSPRQCPAPLGDPRIPEDGKYVNTTSLGVIPYIAKMLSLTVLDRSVEGERVAALPDLIEPVASTIDWRVLRLRHWCCCDGFLCLWCQRLLCRGYLHCRWLWIAERERLHVYFRLLFCVASCQKAGFKYLYLVCICLISSSIGYLSSRIMFSFSIFNILSWRSEDIASGLFLCYRCIKARSTLYVITRFDLIKICPIT